jgi:hypothetical protein
LFLDKDNAGVYNYVPSTESKASPSLICESPELLPHQISIALKDEFLARPSHARDSEEVALGKFSLTAQVRRPAYELRYTAGARSDNFFVGRPCPAADTLPSFTHTQNEKELGMGDKETPPSSYDAYYPVFDEKSGLTTPPCVMETPRILNRIPTDPVCDLSDEVETTEQFSVAHGGFSDIYKGVWARPFCGEKGKTVVCICFISTK